MPWKPGDPTLGDPAAVRRFREVSEAYEVLSVREPGQGCRLNKKCLKAICADRRDKEES